MCSITAIGVQRGASGRRGGLLLELHVCDVYCRYVVNRLCAPETRWKGATSTAFASIRPRILAAITLLAPWGLSNSESYAVTAFIWGLPMKLPSCFTADNLPIMSVGETGEAEI